MLAATPLPSFALFGDRVEVFAAENVTYDNNVFRLSKDLGPIVKDDIYTTSLGFNANVPWSLQRFQLAYTYFATRYRKTGELDFNGHTGHAGWLWSITPRATGDLGYDDARSLASFTQFTGTDRTRDVLDTRTAYGNGAWYTTPSWRVHGATSFSEQTHSDPTRKIYDLRTGNGEAGVSYVTAQDNRVGVAVRGERGKSYDADTSLGQPDFSYKQFGGGLVVHYAITGHSMLDGRAEYTRRTYDSDAFKDFGGPTLRFVHTWNPTVKSQVVTTLRDEISPIQEVQSANFVIVKGISIKPQWLATDKITVGGDLEYNNWNYKGAQAIPGTPTGPGVPTSGYSTRMRTIGLTGSWKPTNNFFLVANYLHEYRTSSLPLQDYKVDVFSIEGRISF
ncbi:MAG TPA: outer membrane beta-barrel protein [Usitatibacter sp.]|nr:outer membrane beta-barrel protein [Usitatibacter sp.]